MTSSCGSSGSDSQKINDTILNKNIEIVYVENGNFNESLYAFEEAVKIIEFFIPIKFNLISVHNINSITEIDTYINSESLIKRGDQAFLNNPIDRFSIIIDKPFTNRLVTGRSKGICTDESVVFVDAKKNFNFAVFVIAHEILHQLGAKHNDCEGCLMTIESYLLPRNIWKISENSLNSFFQCRERLEDFFNVNNNFIFCEF